MTMLTDFIPVGVPIVTPPGTGTTSCWIIKYLNTDTNKNIRHRQRDNILWACHPCLLHSVSDPEVWMFGFLLFYSEKIFVCSRLSIDWDQSQIARKFDPIFSKRKYIHHTWTWSVLKTNNMTLFWQNRPRHQRHDTIPVRPELRCVVTVQCFPQMNNW